MNVSKIAAIAIVTSLSGAALIAGGSPASAHASGQTYGSTPTSGAYGHVFLRIPHGCDGDATNAIAVVIPAGASSVKPQGKPGWVVSKTTDASGAQVVTWSGGALENSQFDDFGLSLKWPTIEHDVESETVYFKVVQTCDADLAETARTDRNVSFEGALPALAGKRVGLFVGGKRIAVVRVNGDGQLSASVASRLVPAGSPVIVMRGGVQVGTTQAGTAAWVDVPADGQDAHSLAHPAVGVVVMAASGHAAGH